MVLDKTMEPDKKNGLNKKSSRERNGSSEDEEFSQRLWSHLDASSRTFSFVLKFLPKPLSFWLGAGYLGARIIDEIEDSDLADMDKEYLIKRVPSVLRGSAEDETKSLESMLSGIGMEKDEGYRELLSDIGFVHYALGKSPADVQDIVRKYYAEMADGLSNPAVQNIQTLADHHRYCHYAAGTVGMMVTELARRAGYFTDEKMRKVMPNPDVWEFGVNSAHDFGVALQLVNDIRDLEKDGAEGIYRWPAELVADAGFSYDELLSLQKSDTGKLKKAHALLNRQLDDAKPYVLSAVNWIEELPYEPSGLRRCWTDALGMSVATMRVIDTPEFFYNPDKRKISREEVEVIDNQSKLLAENKETILPFINHLFEKPAITYGQ